MTPPQPGVPPTRAALRRALPGRVRQALWWVHGSVRSALRRAYVRRLGIDTGWRADDGGGLEPRDSEHTFYTAGDWIPIRQALRALRPGPADVFADLGAGKGQALVVAGRLPFGRVVGVEISPRLSEIARANLARAGHRFRAREFEVLTCDAVDWRVPDDLSILFLYSPFVGDAFGAVLDGILASHERAPRPLHVVYAYPWEHNRLLASGRMRVVDVRAAQWPSSPWWPHGPWVVVTYRVTAAGAGSDVAPIARPRTPLARRALRLWSAPNDQRFGIRWPGGHEIWNRD